VTIPERAYRRHKSPWTRIAVTLAGSALIALLPAHRLGAQRSELEKFIRHRVLTNGLEVTVAENHGVPLATIEINVRNGSFTQRPGSEGLAHMYEHMFFKANAQLPEPDAFIQRSSELGASFNGTTVEERVNYYMSLPAASLAGGIKLMIGGPARPEVPEPGTGARATGRSRRVRSQRIESLLRAAAEDGKGAVSGAVEPQEHHRGA
jgi:zinc protease